MQKAHPMKPHRINLTTDKGTSSHAKELTGQFGFDEFISIPMSGSVLMALVDKSVRKAGEIYQKPLAKDDNFKQINVYS
jgi:uncharacterized lipoprotein YbaY